MYKNSSAGMNDYVTYRYIKKGAPYVTSEPVQEGRQIRYICWMETIGAYVEVARSGEFRKVKITSHSKVSSITQKAAICAWALNGVPTHGSRRYSQVWGLWESKLGEEARITHGYNELEGSVYEISEAFEKCFKELWEGWNSEEFRYESNTKSIRRLPAYKEIMELGEEVLPLLVAKLADEQYFFAVPFYDEMQSKEELLISYSKEQYQADVLEGEQQRAKRTALLYLEQ